MKPPLLRVYAIDGLTPVVHPSAFVHASAVLIGDVVIGPDCYIGPCVSLRGDFGRICIEVGARLQETCIVQGRPGGETLIESGVCIGDGALLQGCRIRQRSRIGDHAVVGEDVDLGEGSIVAAMAYVVRLGIVAPYSLIAGVPARVMRTLSEDERRDDAEGDGPYQVLAVGMQRRMTASEPLMEPESDRRRLPPQRTPLHLLPRRECT